MGALYAFYSGKWYLMENAVELTARATCQMEPRDRLQAVEYMRARFCIHCGYDKSETGSCHCTNDE